MPATRTGTPEPRSPRAGRRSWPGRLGVAGAAARALGLDGNLPGMVEGDVIHRGGLTSVGRRRSSGAAVFSLATALRRAMVGPRSPCSARPFRGR
jgi:hypothetical protein